MWPIALVAAAFTACARPPSCDPAEYGRQCEPELKPKGQQYSQCEDPSTTCTNACWGNRTGWEIKGCPAWQPRCIDAETEGPPDIACLGELIGTCSTPGFVRCENDEIVVECVKDEHGQLVLSRGSCGDFHVCVGIGKTQYPGCVFHTNV